jgi:hypothetical protein
MEVVFANFFIKAILFRFSGKLSFTATFDACAIFVHASVLADGVSVGARTQSATQSKH